MKIIWQIDPEDVTKVQSFFSEHRNSAFVTMRIKNNLRESKLPISKEAFWERMIGCLLTSQQRSGPDSPVTRFVCTSPSPLEYKSCNGRSDLENFARQVLSNFGGLRFSTTIGERLASNMELLNTGGWGEVSQHLDRVRQHPNPDNERLAAAYIDDTFKGFGAEAVSQPVAGIGALPIRDSYR